MQPVKFFLLPFFFKISLAAVGQVAVELPKMNVMYEGLSNPLTVVVNDVPDSCVSLRPSFGQIRRWRKSNFEWSGASDSLDILEIEILDSCKNEFLGKRLFRLKQIRVKILLGAKHQSKLMGNGEFKAQGGIAAVVTGWDIEAKCDMIGFKAEFFRKKTGDVVSFQNIGARWTAEVKPQIERVLPGDWVRFSEFSYRCPGHRFPQRAEEDLIFQIK